MFWQNGTKPRILNSRVKVCLCLLCGDISLSVFGIFILLLHINHKSAFFTPQIHTHAHTFLEKPHHQHAITL